MIYSVVYVITATSLVATSDSWPPIDVTPFAGSRLGPQSDPLGTHRRKHEPIFGSLCGPHGRVASRTAKRPTVLCARFHEGLGPRSLRGGLCAPTPARHCQ